ncbi:MAG: thioredoxin 1 [Candidatus Argoarchaeum ethanivorans]|uniref:Thioredoxin 1 n=1 Tax=Candidatus Argoarchaeum ethanivorans TaxID=2608793 RepID=A0A8B6SDG3_9EURY|nr:MAG: thioredoxin 1 [Candidatus Argoarchaeum ethanivorans]
MDELEQIRKKKLDEMKKRFSPGTASKTEEATASPVRITDTNFDETVRKYPLVVIDCWATWCKPCQMIGPIIDAMAKDYAGKIVFGKLNVDENPRSSRKYGIMSIPALLVFKNGQLMEHHVPRMDNYP